MVTAFAIHAIFFIMLLATCLVPKYSMSILVVRNCPQSRTHLSLLRRRRTYMEEAEEDIWLL